MKTAERQEARRLRGDGWSIKQIERHLGVARSSVSLWVRDIELSPEALAKLTESTRRGPLVAAERRSTDARAIRVGYQLRGRELIHERGGDYAAGCALFWAEGSRRRNSVEFTNSDPDMVAFFLRFMRIHLGVDSARLHCNLFADHVARQTEIEEYWLRRLDLPRDVLRASTVNYHSKYSQKKRTNKLPYGTARLSVHSTEIVQTIYGSIQELGGFDRPAWLD